MDADVALVVSPRDWAERFHRFVADHGGARVRARVLDAREAVEADYDVLVAEDVTSFLTPRLVEELHRCGRRVLAVHDPSDPGASQRLDELGVDERVALEASPEELLQVIATLAAGMRLDEELDALVAAPPAPPTPIRRGAVIAVAGCAGGVGATEVALGIAVALNAARGASTVLVDADTVAPSIAQRLSLPLHPNVRAAVDAAVNRAGRLAGTLRRLPDGLHVLAGLPSGRDWSHLRAGEAATVVADLAALHDHVVVNLSWSIEDLAGYGGPPRHDVARTLLPAADTVVAVAAPTPVGVARLLEWAANLRALCADTPAHVVVNRVPPGPFRRGELADEIRRCLAVASLTFLPADPRVEQAAWEGWPVGPGPFSRALAGFVAELVGLPARGRP